MVVFPNAKVNLGLNVIRKRSDGFHDIETIFLPVGLTDVLEVVPAYKKVVFNSTGIPIPDNGKDNLVVQAWQILRDKYKIPAVNIHLHKVIPIGAGLGGGSSDAAFMLRVLNNLFELKCSDKELEMYASLMGSDCAFFIKDQIAYAQGKGDKLEPLDIDLQQYKIILIYPGIHISTVEAYKGVVPKMPEAILKSLVSKPLNIWKELIYNDFETSVFKSNPDLPGIKEELLNSGALYAAMSGSGSSIYGIYPKQQQITISEKITDQYFFWEGYFI